MEEAGGAMPAPRAAARAGTWVGPALFALALAVPLPDLAVGGRAVAAGFGARVVLGLTAWMATWWMTEAVPLAVTSLLPLVVLPAAGVSSAKVVAPAYFDDTIALFLGGFCLALALERSGLHRRIALRVLRVFGTRPRGMVLGFLSASAVISMWVSNTATALMLLPVALTTIGALAGADPAARTREERAFAAACVLAVAYGASIGGVGTLVGTPPNMILKGVYDPQLGGSRGPLAFGQWMALGVPLVLLMVPAAWWILVRVALRVPARFAEEGARPPRASAVVAGLGRWSRAEKVVLVTFLATALAWMTHQAIDLGGFVVPGTGWDAAFRFGGRESSVTDATIAVAAALLLFLAPSRSLEGGRVLTWEFAQARIPWGALLLFGGGFSLAASFSASGLDEYLKALFAGLDRLPPVLVVGVVAAGVTLLSEVASNTATAAMVLPLLVPVAAAVGVDPGLLLAAGAMAASCGFALPVATAANLFAYGSGQVTAGEMGRAGILLDVVGVVVVTAVVLLLGPLALG
jgi:sodium-dependent dicarboxylate transporter 2/3/5